MENNIENGVDSQIDTQDVDTTDEGSEDVTVLQEKVQKLSESNKQLYARAKKAEGFELKDGKWVKPLNEAKPQVDKPAKESPQPEKREGTTELDYGEKAYLRSAMNLKGADELQLAKEWKAKYGTTVEEMETDEVFVTKLRNLREAGESQNAIPKGKGRSGQTGVTDVDIAIAKYKEKGELPKDFKTRSEVVKKLVEEQKTGNVFSGPSVIGPNVQEY